MFTVRMTEALPGISHKFYHYCILRREADDTVAREYLWHAGPHLRDDVGVHAELYCGGSAGRSRGQAAVPRAPKLRRWSILA